MAVLLLILLLWGTAVSAQEQCLKLVFNRFCLGGEIAKLQKQHPGFIHRQREGDRYALVYAQGQERIYVMAYQGRIYKILKQFKPATRLKYTDLEALLTGKYGSPEEMSSFPPYTSSLASKIGAIRRGDGRAQLRWHPQGTSWQITLSWTREMGLALAYAVGQLELEQRESLEDGY